MRLSFVGDMVCSKEHIRSLEESSASLDFDTIFKFAKNKLSQSDFLVGNLETPIAGEELGITSHKWSFNSPIEFAESIKRAGFDLVSLANNHCLDRGIEGAKKTVRTLNKIKLDNVGINIDRHLAKYKINNIKGIQVGFLSYTYGTNYQVNRVKLNKKNEDLVNIFNHQERILQKWQLCKRLINKLQHKIFWLRAPIRLRNMLNEVKRCRQSGAEIVVMSLHIGGQYNDMPEKYTKWVVDKLFRAGVDIIAACHEHVIHPIIINKNNAVCAMSLGNFIYHPASESLPVSAVKKLKADYSIMLNIDINRNGKLPKIKKVSFSIFKNHIIEGLARVLPIEKVERLNLIERSQLKNDVNYIVKKVIGLEGDFEIKKEYIVYE